MKIFDINSRQLAKYKPKPVLVSGEETFRDPGVLRYTKKGYVKCIQRNTNLQRGNKQGGDKKLAN